MRTICILDTVYSEFLDQFPLDRDEDYESQLSGLLHQSFGTFDAYSRGLRALGWNAIDIIVNAHELQHQWDWEHDGAHPGNVLMKQLSHYRPDVIFLQDLNIDLPIRFHPTVGQCSCPMPPRHKVKQCDAIFTSFPHYLQKFEDMGIRAIYNPLGFDPIILERTLPTARDLDVIFVGGVGNPGHWKEGMETLEAVARAFPSFRWWGYGAETLPATSALQEKYQGPAWGLDMYQLFRRAKIVLNRHGEVAEGFANNMRLFEASGCGAAVLTEVAPNLSDFFAGFGECAEPEVLTYRNPTEAVAAIRFLLNSNGWREVGAAGRRRTLRDHTYAQRMETISETLKTLVPNDIG